ncbi:hypothetical protein K469DRAFT_686009 [Zopfia rhizophila CBS 207.26]|uniref:Uncharacterized protein n=1 Tax=Zopfia rhizophila CBS 207.26 TaxID=1314779 RepID=A0A6A6DAK8_9PEZI|nr:hypothetical protein K469DRAFT_686009 [Zopfia rhizophila CBS 207.26]
MQESLLDYLTRKNPQVLLCKSDDVCSRTSSRKGKNTKNKAYYHPRRIKRWEDFRDDFGAFRSMYAEVLSLEAQRPGFEIPLENSVFRIVRNEDGIGTIIYEWNSKLVSQALVETMEALGKTDRIYMVRGCFAKPVPKLRPDWAGICKKDEGQVDAASPQQEESVLPGDTKCSKSWTAKEIREGLYESNRWNHPEWYWPLAQIYTYCYQLQTRYGYLVTDEELVVIRVGPDVNAPRMNGPITMGLERESLVNYGMLEFASIPWDNGQEVNGSLSGDGDELSINVALWGLHLLAAKDCSLKWEYDTLEKDIFHTDPLDSAVNRSTTPRTQPSSSAHGEQGNRAFRSSVNDPIQSFNSQTSLTSTASRRSRRSTRARRSTTDDPALYSFNNAPSESFNLLSSLASRASGQSRGVKRKAKTDNPSRSDTLAGKKRKN